MQRARARGGIARMREVEHEAVAQPLQQMSVVSRNDLFGGLEEQAAHASRRCNLVSLYEADRLDDIREDDGPGGVIQRIDVALADMRWVAGSCHGVVQAHATERKDRPIMRHWEGPRTSLEGSIGRLTSLTFFGGPDDRPADAP